MAPVDRHLLFGIIAVQNGLIDQTQLVDAFRAWTRDKHESLADVLVARGDLDAADRSALEALVDRHVTKHGGDISKSISSVSAGWFARNVLDLVNDPELRGRLTPTAEDLSRTFAPGSVSDEGVSGPLVGTSSSCGLRFRVLRPHARGGLGVVFVAIDDELRREVALKQIRADHADDPVCRQRFLQEAEITGGLEHPGIVPVYGLGTYSGGRPFYAMRFISGDSLKEAVERFHGPVGPSARAGPDSAGDAAGRAGPAREADSRSLGLRRLLRRFLDVCNAIEYAHSRGVLHRDIKPGNIIVGKHGETLVVDWGLAKPMGRGGPAQDVGERTGTPGSASGSAETMPGQAMGTPAYMSPEQAAGDLEKLGPWSDVYALGATLYCLLTGRAPFEGEVLDVLGRVRKGEFSPPRQLDPTIDRALEAVCLKAMALRPEDRYDSCRALADDLDRWLADEPVTAWREPLPRRARRWARRHRTLVSTASALLVLSTVGLSVFGLVIQGKNRELVAQRNRAEVRERQAVAAVKRFGDAVAQNFELKNSPALADLRETLLSEPLTFFQSLRDLLQADRDTQPDVLARLASSADELGYLTTEIGDERNAVVAYREALEIWARLAQEDPARADFQCDLAGSHNNLGGQLFDLGDAAGARRSYGSALAILERLAREHPDVTEYQSDLARSQSNLGSLLSTTGDVAGSRRWYESAIRNYERLARQNPTIIAFHSDLARTLNRLGRVLSTTGDAEGARRSYTSALAIQERLAREQPTAAQYQSGLADSHFCVAVLLRDNGDPVGARRSYEAALAIRDRLAREYPTVTQFWRDLAQSHNGLGVLLEAIGDPAGARRSYESALAVRERLAHEHPGLVQFQNELAGSHNDLGKLLAATGEMPGARRSYESALAIQERLAQQHPTVDRFQREHAVQLLNLGNLLLSNGDSAGARRSYEPALAILERLARLHPEVTEFPSDLARVHNNLGILLRQSNDPAGARRSHESALAIRERLARDYPDVTEYRFNLAQSHKNLGNLLDAEGDAAGARRSYESALAILSRLAQEHPESPDSTSELGSTLNSLAWVDLNAKRFAEARDRLREAIGLQKKALAASPRSPSYRKLLTTHYGNLRLAALGLKDNALLAEAESGQAELEASDLRLQALDTRLAEVLKGAAPGDNSERLELAQRAYDTKRPSIAARLWAEAIEADPNLADDRRKQIPYNAACAAVLAATGGGGDGPPPDEKTKAMLRGQALGWLRGELKLWGKLVESGPPQGKAFVAQTLDHWRRDTDLGGVRDSVTLGKLPDAERQAWRSFWDDVAALRARL